MGQLESPWHELLLLPEMMNLRVDQEILLRKPRYVFILSSTVLFLLFFLFLPHYIKIRVLVLQARALDQVLKDINTRFGKGSIMKLGSNTFGEVKTTPSGALTLDLALGGGYPVGRVVEIYGPESSGKTTLALHAMAEVQKRGGNVALIDAEHAFDPVFAKHLGLDVKALYLCQPDTGEMALEVADQLIRSSAMDLIAVDSVAALVPRAEIEGEIGQITVGLQARLMSAALRKIAGNASRHDCTIIFLNQLRQKVGVIYGSPEVTSGGQALKYYASVRMEVRIKERISAGADGQIGIRVKYVLFCFLNF